MSALDLERIIVGNIVIYPALRDFLKKSHYFMSYDSKTEIISFKANHLRGGEVLFEIRNASHENAVKLAEKLGLKADCDPAMSWSKWNPIYELYNDDSKDAEKLRIEMLRLGLPFVSHGTYFNYGEVTQRSWAWTSGGHRYVPPMWSVDKVLEKIREDAERYKEQIATTP